MEADNIVIGSGPCGTIAAAALSALRQRTVVIDAGMSLDARACGSYRATLEI